MSLLLQTAAAIERRLDGVLEAVELSTPKYSALTKLAEAGEPLALSELAARLTCVRSKSGRRWGRCGSRSCGRWWRTSWRGSRKRRSNGRLRRCGSRVLSRGYTLGMAIDYSDYIVQDPQICGGEPVVRSTQVPVRTVLASLAEGPQSKRSGKIFLP